MKNKLVCGLFLLLSCASTFAMEPGTSSVTFATSRETVTFSPEEVAGLNSRLLQGLFGELSGGDCGSIPVDINKETVEFIKKLLNSDDKDTLLGSSCFSQNNDWTDLINALEYLQAEELLNYVIEWMNHHIDFTRFNGSNICTRELFSLRSLLTKKLPGHILSNSLVRTSFISHDFLAVEAQDSSFIVTTKDRLLNIWRLDEEHNVIGDPGTFDQSPIWGSALSGTSLAIAPDNSFVVIEWDNGRGVIWRLDGAHHIIGDPQILNHDGWVKKVVVAPDSSFVVTASSDHTAKIWRLNEAHELLGEPIILHHDAMVGAVAIAYDNSFVVTASLDHTAKIWRLDEDHNVIGDPEILNHNYSVFLLALAPDNSFVVTESDHRAAIWRLDEEHKVIGAPQILNHNGLINKFVVASDSSFVVTASSDRTVKIWRLDEDRNVIGDPRTLNHDGYVNSLALASDSSFLLTGAYDHTKIWKLDEDRNVIGDPAIFTQESLPISIAQDNSFVLTQSGRGGGIRIHKGIEDLSNLTIPELLFVFKLLGQSHEVIDLRCESKELKMIYESFPQKLKQRLRAHVRERSFWDKIKSPCMWGALIGVGGFSYLAYKLLNR